MTTPNFEQMLGKVGVSAEVVAIRDGEIDARLTAGQFEKLVTVLPTTVYVKVSKGRIIASVFIMDLEKAIEENAKAPRVASNVKITSVMMYSIETDNTTTNILTGALWDADNKTGYIVINGENHPVRVGKAEEFYEAPEDAESEWNPERPVFVMAFDVEPIEQDDETKIVLTSYGFTNLIRRVAAVRKHIIF